MTTHDQQSVQVALHVDNSALEAKVDVLTAKVETLIGLLQGKTTGSYTAADAAKQLQIPRKRVYDLLAQGALKGVRFGETWRISAAALQEFIDHGPRRPEPVDARRVLPLRR